MKNWTMETLDREAERISRNVAPEAIKKDLYRAVDVQDARAVLIATHGHPAK